MAEDYRDYRDLLVLPRMKERLRVDFVEERRRRWSTAKSRRRRRGCGCRVVDALAADARCGGTAKLGGDFCGKSDDGGTFDDRTEDHLKGNHFDDGSPGTAHLREGGLGGGWGCGGGKILNNKGRYPPIKSEKNTVFKHLL